MESPQAYKSELLKTIANFPKYATHTPLPPMTQHNPYRDLLGEKPQLRPQLAGREKVYTTTGTEEEREGLEELMVAEKEALGGQRARAL